MDEKKCVICGGGMTRGRAVIKKSFPARLAWPWASDRLDFRPDGDESHRETVIRQGMAFESFKCVQCGALVLTRDKWFPV